MTEAEFQVGELIENRYRVLSVIGSGGMGTLYLVSDEAHHDGAREGEMVALKTVRLHVPAAEKPESVERFQREFQILTQLQHPNLVSVYNYGVTAEGELYFTMEWVQGQDLESRLRQLQPAVTIPLMIQVCRALAYLHARGVIHGDLKPSNVLMTADANDQVKIVDFGVALEVRSPEVRARYYTPGYSAPEVRQPGPIDHRADLYSLGAMWYALLVGEAPLFLPGTERLIPLMLDDVLEEQEEIPVAVGAVITRLMATSREERYASANEVIEAVNEITGSVYVLETRETASSYALRTHFVNREAEMEMLQALWEQAQWGEGKLVLISGEGGVGKTRLVTELEVQAELEGARVVWGQCVESGGSAYQPWREVLRLLIRYVEGADGAGLEMKRVGPVLATLLPELWQREYMVDAAPPAELVPQATQLRLNSTIVEVLRAAAGLRPTVIVIEDTHWADEATLVLLSFLARVPGQAGLLVCVAYRDDEVGPEHPLAMLEGNRVGRIPLRNLSPEVTADLVRSMLGLEQLPISLMERVQRTTGGNAFFAQELIRSLAEDGAVLHRTVAGWEVDRAALQEARLPESIRQVVWQRLEHLSVESWQVLRWAALVGSVFWDGSVGEIGQVSRAWVQAALQQGLEQELVFERVASAFEGEREYMFTNSTVREVSYESILPQEQQEVHGRVAAWLMAHSAEQALGHLGLIAGHLEKAGQVGQAVAYLRRAGEQAAAQFSNAEAVAYFSRALDLTPEDTLTERYALLLAREQVYGVQGAREAQACDLAALKELAEVLADDRRRAEVALRHSHYAEATGDYPAAIAAAQVAIALAQAAQDVSSEAAGYIQWGQALWWQGDYDAARAQLEEALALAQGALLRQVEADSLRDLGNVSWTQGDYDRAQTCYEPALWLFREIGDRWGESFVLNKLGTVSLEEFDFAGARTYYEQSLYICRDIGERRGESTALNNIGLVFTFLGSHAEGRSCLEQSLRICREISDREGEGRALSNLGLVSHYLSDDEVAREYSQQAVLITQEIGTRRSQGYSLTYLGHALAGLGRLAEAADAYRQALTLRRELGQSHLAMDSLAGLARVSLAQSDPIQAQTHVEEILRYEESNTLDGTEEPFRIYLTCYHVLQANQDSRAQTILSTAHNLLQEQATKITDEELRCSFLENVAAHWEIVREFAKGRPISGRQ